MGLDIEYQQKLGVPAKHRYVGHFRRCAVIVSLVVTVVEKYSVSCIKKNPDHTLGMRMRVASIALRSTLFKSFSPSVLPKVK